MLAPYNTSRFGWQATRTLGGLTSLENTGALDVRGEVVSAFATTEKLERRGLNPRRMERYVAAVREGGATPVAVRNKADLPGYDSEELGDVRRELSARLGVDVVCARAETRLGLDELRQHA